jgi:hypothetical protein
MWNRRHRWLRRLAAGFAFAGLVIPTAAQAHQPQISGGSDSGSSAKYDGYGYIHSSGVPLDQQTQYNGYGYVQSPGVPLAQQTSDVAVRPDDRAVRVSPEPVESTVVRPDDRAVRINPQPIESTVVRPDDRSVRFTPSGGELPQVVAEPSTGFDWSDAGIGAGLALGLMLLALGAILATRHANKKALAGA